MRTRSAQIELLIPTGLRPNALKELGEGPQLYYKGKNGSLFVGDAAAWLRSLKDSSVDLVFADPPYNIGKADWDNLGTMREYVAWCVEWAVEVVRILKPSGSLYLCGFSEILADVKVGLAPMFARCRWIVWHYKNKANLGNDWGRSHESILHFRHDKFALNTDQVRIPYGAHTLRYPSHPQAVTSQFGRNEKTVREKWTPNPLGAKPKDVLDIPTTCNGMGERTPHPTQKPEELLRRLILASSRRDELVVDPFSGSGTTAVAAEQLGRRWLCCDLKSQHNEWAVSRLEKVPRRTIEKWIELDRKTAARRESIR